MPREIRCGRLSLGWRSYETKDADAFMHLRQRVDRCGPTKHRLFTNTLAIRGQVTFNHLSSAVAFLFRWWVLEELDGLTGVTRNRVLRTILNSQCMCPLSYAKSWKPRRWAAHNAIMALLIFSSSVTSTPYLSRFRFAKELTQSASSGPLNLSNGTLEVLAAGFPQTRAALRHPSKPRSTRCRRRYSEVGRYPVPTIPATYILSRSGAEERSDSILVSQRLSWVDRGTTLEPGRKRYWETVSLPPIKA